MSTTPNPLNNSAFMNAFLDTFIPASADGTMPSAGALGITEVVAAAIEADAVFGPVVYAGLGAIAGTAAATNSGGFANLSPGDRVAAIREALAQRPSPMNAFARYLYPVYYQHPRVLEAIGEPARPPFPEGFDIEPTDPALLAILESRR